MKTLFFSLLVLANSISGFGQTAYVTNGSSTNWSLSTAWTPNGVPDIDQWPNDNVTINHNMTFTGNLTARSSSGYRTIVTINSGAQLTVSGTFVSHNGLVNVKSGAAVSANKITIRNNGDLNIESGASATAATDLAFESNSNSVTNSGTLTVGGSVTFTGASVLSSSGTLSVTNNLTITNGADVLLSGNNTIGGNISVVGGGTDLDLTGGTLDVTGSVTVNSDGNFGIGGSATIGGDLSITGSGGSTVTGSVIVTGALNTANNGYVNGTGIVGWGTSDINPANSGAFLQCNNGTNYDDNAVTAQDPPPANPIDLTTCSAALPIELLVFTGSYHEDRVLLSWTTATETNNDYFTIERSENGIDWIQILDYPGAGNSSTILNYNSIDESPLFNGGYYRLKQTDFDSRYSYSKVIYVPSEAINNKMFIYPNPTTDIINITVNEHYLPCTFQLIEIGGKSLLNENITHQNSVIDLSKYPKGIYFLRATFLENTLVERIILE